MLKLPLTVGDHILTHKYTIIHLKEQKLDQVRGRILRGEEDGRTHHILGRQHNETHQTLFERGEEWGIGI
jgi:hypothetical protein